MTKSAMRPIACHRNGGLTISSRRYARPAIVGTTCANFVGASPKLRHLPIAIAIGTCPLGQILLPRWMGQSIIWLQKVVNLTRAGSLKLRPWSA